MLEMNPLLPVNVVHTALLRQRGVAEDLLGVALLWALLSDSKACFLLGMISSSLRILRRLLDGAVSSDLESWRRIFCYPPA